MTADQLPPIFVINLKDSLDRRTNITAQLSALGCDFEFVEAVDGRNLNEEELKQYSKEATIQNWTNKAQRGLSPGEIGCALSHLKVYQKIADEGIEEAVILEDDAVMGTDFVDVLRNRDLFPEDWMIVQLDHETTYMFSRGAPVSFWGRKQIYRNYKIARFVEYTWRNTGCLIRKETAKILLDFGYPVRMTSDTLTSGNCGEIAIKSYGIKPPCISLATHVQSDISARGRGLEKLSGMSPYVVGTAVFLMQYPRTFHFLRVMRRLVRRLMRLMRRLMRLMWS